MWIYKITNIQNNKVYIGQSKRPIEQRFKRHLNDALHNKLDTHFARAIRKYGANNFIIEIIDSAFNQEELTLKEQYWIRYYNSTNIGYNETDALYKSGGNTYKSKSTEEMISIKDKIRSTKMGNKNPNARSIKRININTREESIFGSIIECAKACGIKEGKTSITTRLNGQLKSPYKDWIFEYV